jgi:hypothetical protein
MYTERDQLEKRAHEAEAELARRQRELQDIHGAVRSLAHIAFGCMEQLDARQKEVRIPRARGRLADGAPASTLGA